MKRLHAWVLRERRGIERIPRLEDALLGRRPFVYVAHRLRYATVRIVLRTILHIVEVVALASVFPTEYLAPILFLRHSVTLVTSAHWGALEVQRNALREARRRRDEPAFSDICSRWQAAAVILVVLEQLLVVAFLWSLPREFSGFSIYDAYAVACGLRLAEETWTRTLQSEVFSVARIRRPLWSMVLVDLVEVVGLLFAWLRIGAFAFALVLALGGTLRAAFTLLFTSATRRQLRLPKRSHSVWRALSDGSVLELPLASAARHALLNLTLQIDSLAILLLSGGAAGGSGVALSLSIHALAPLFGAGFTWARIFYFDFVQLRLHRIPLLRARFGRILDLVAVSYTLVLMGLTLPVVTWLLPNLLSTLPFGIVIFALSRSLFALRQMEAFSYADHRIQLRQLLVALALAALCTASFRSLEILVVGVSCGLLVAVFANSRARPNPAVEPATSLSREHFVLWLKEQSGPLRLIRITIDRRHASLGRIRRALPVWGLCSPQLQLNRQRLLVAVTVPADEKELRSLLAAKSGGTVAALEIGPSMSSGRKACASLKDGAHEMAPGATRPVPGFGVELTSDSGAAVAVVRSSPSAEELARQFTERFPDGVCLTRSTGNMRRLGAEARGALSAVLLAASGRARFQKPARHRNVEVALFRPDSDAAQVYLLPRSSPRRGDFAEFRRTVEEASWAACLSEALRT